MSVRGLLVAIVLLGILAGAAYWSDRTKDSTAENAGKSDTPKLVSLKPEDIRQIEIRRQNAPAVLLEREKDKNWAMKSPEPLAVDQEAANSLSSAYTGLSWDRLVEEKAGDLSPFGLNTPSVEVRVTGFDGKTSRLLIGSDTPTGGGSYAKIDGDPRVFRIYSGTKTSLEKSHVDLRDKRLLTFDPQKLTRLEVMAKGQTIEFGKNASNEWQIVKPRPFRADNLQVEELVRKLQEARMDTSTSGDAAGKSAAAAAASATRVAIAKVTDASGTQQIEILKPSKDKVYYARSSVVQGLQKVAGDLEGFEKGLDEYRNKKIFDFGFSEPAKIEIRSDGKTYSFTKGGEKWWANGKEVDVVGVQSLIDKVRDLNSIKFVETGFTTPSIDIAVHSNEGKRIEKVQISKSGSGFFAKRENDSATYELDAKAVDEMLKAAADVKETTPPAKK